MEQDGEIRLRRLGEFRPFPPQNIPLSLEKGWGRGGRGTTSFHVKRSFPLPPESPILIGNRALEKRVDGAAQKGVAPPEIHRGAVGILDEVIV